MNPKDIPHECVCAVCNEPMVSASEYAAVKADNARLAAQVKACQDLVHVALPPDGKREPWPVCLNNLLAPTVRKWHFLSNTFRTGWASECETRHDVIEAVERIAVVELARLQAVMGQKT